MLIALMSSLALAGTPVEEVRGALSQYPDAGGVVSCAPLSGVTDVIGVFAKNKPKETTQALDGLLFDLAQEGGGTALGVDVSGTLTVVGGAEGDKRPLLVRLPFNGTAAQAEALVKRFDTGATAAGDGWDLTVKGKKMHASVANGRLTVADASPPGARSRSESTLLVDLPTAPGCVALFHPPKKAGDKLPLTELGLYAPLKGGAPMVLRLGADKPLPKGFSRTDAPIPFGYLDQPPDSVVTISTPLEDLLVGVMELDEKGKGRAALLEELHAKVQLPSGASFALIGNPRSGGQWVGMAQVLNEKGRPFPRGGLVKKAVKELGGGEKGSVDRVDRTTFSMTAGKGKNVVYVHAAKGGYLVVGSSAELTKRVSDTSTGVPWLDDAGLAAAREAPLLVRAAQEGADVRFAVREHQGALELTAEVKLSPEKREAMKMGMGLMASAMLPMMKDKLEGSMAKLGGGGEAAGGELSENVYGIRIAELAYDAAFDEYLAMPPAPRAKEALDTKAVAWPSGTEWDKLGWRPDGDVSGTYWVEVSADGQHFTVHGMQDADGDGKPAHWTATDEAMPAALTPPDVK